MTGPEPRWVPRLVIEAVHLDQLREHGGLIGVRDETALESALARARQRWAYAQDSDLSELAACYAFGISTNHPFLDGNKRVALLAAVVFLGLNGLDLIAPEAEVVDTMMLLAAGEMDEASLARWIRGRCHPRRS